MHRAGHKARGAFLRVGEHFLPRVERGGEETGKGAARPPPYSFVRAYRQSETPFLAFFLVGLPRFPPGRLRCSIVNYDEATTCMRMHMGKTECGAMCTALSFRTSPAQLIPTLAGLVLSSQLSAPHNIFKRPAGHDGTDLLEAHEAADRRAREALDAIVREGVEQSLVPETAVEEEWRRDSLWLRIDVVHSAGGAVPATGLGVVGVFPPHLIVRRDRGGEGGWGWYVFNRNVVLKSV